MMVAIVKTLVMVVTVTIMVVMVKMVLTLLVVVMPMVVTALMLAMEEAYSRSYLQCWGSCTSSSGSIWTSSHSPPRASCCAPPWSGKGRFSQRSLCFPSCWAHTRWRWGLSSVGFWSNIDWRNAAQLAGRSCGESFALTWVSWSGDFSNFV